MIRILLPFAEAHCGGYIGIEVPFDFTPEPVPCIAPNKGLTPNMMIMEKTHRARKEFAYTARV